MRRRRLVAASVLSRRQTKEILLFTVYSELLTLTEVCRNFQRLSVKVYLVHSTTELLKLHRAIGRLK